MILSANNNIRVEHLLDRKPVWGIFYKDAKFSNTDWEQLTLKLNLLSEQGALAIWWMFFEKYKKIN